jgi:hypothetical protein
MKKLIDNFLNRFQSLQDNLQSVKKNTRASLKQQELFRELELDRYLQEHLYGNPKYDDVKRLTRYEFKAFSQSGEDGIISEIFNRIGTTNQFFVEFGVGNGLENNTAYLLIKNWRGYWIEGSQSFCQSIRRDFAEPIERGQLTLQNAFITAENIETLFQDGAVPIEPDLLSIDIDGNDYWVWQSIVNYRPRVVIVEYNAIYPPECSWVMQYNPKHQWRYDSYMGTSLKALEKLAERKGYRLVGCNFAGMNAFFVREDLLGDRFCEPCTAENHYEPARYFLCAKTNGHPRAWGAFKTID